MTTYDYCSHLSVNLCFPWKATFLTSTRSPGSIFDYRALTSYLALCLRPASSASLDAVLYAKSIFFFRFDTYSMQSLLLIVLQYTQSSSPKRIYCEPLGVARTSSRMARSSCSHVWLHCRHGLEALHMISSLISFLCLTSQAFLINV